MLVLLSRDTGLIKVKHLTEVDKETLQHLLSKSELLKRHRKEINKKLFLLKL